MHTFFLTHNGLRRKNVRIHKFSACKYTTFSRSAKISGGIISLYLQKIRRHEIIGWQKARQASPAAMREAPAGSCRSLSCAVQPSRATRPFISRYFSILVVVLVPSV